MTDPRYAATIAEAKQVAQAVMISHIGDVNAMASAETLAILDRLKANEALMFATIRVLAGAGIALANGGVELQSGFTPGTTEYEARVAALVRWVIDKLEYTVNDE